MKKILLPAVVLCWINMAFGQTFMASPSTVLTRELAFNQANECYIYFTNPSGDSLHLRWRLVESNLPDNWVADLCDYGTCYSGIPSNGLMNVVEDTIQPYLKLIVQPGENAGACWIWFRAYENGNQSNEVDVFFNLHTSGTLKAEEWQITGSVLVFPNPVSDELLLNNQTPEKRQILILNGSGDLYWKGTIPPTNTITLPVSHWPEGTYLYHTGKKTGKILLLH